MKGFDEGYGLNDKLSRKEIISEFEVVLKCL